MYAKILNNQLIKYPYQLKELLEENPYTRFDDSIDLPTLYSRTEDAANTGASIVEIVYAEIPTLNSNSERVVFDDLPTLINGAWVLGNTIVVSTQEELLPNIPVVQL
jgi:hypothetical protein